MNILKKLNELSSLKSFRCSSAGAALIEKPLGFIDVGARGGVHHLVAPIADLTAVLGFEPDPQGYQELLKQKDQLASHWAAFELSKAGLYNEKGQSKLHLLTASTNNSLLPPNSAYIQRYQMDKWHCVGEEVINTISLDEVVSDPQYDQYNFGEFIKLDTQGTEYEILSGARQLLSSRTVAVVTEVAFCELYQGQKLFSEIEILLRECGFAFYGFYPIHTRSKKLLNKRTHQSIERAFYADAVFFKDPLSNPQMSQNFSQRQVSVLFTTAILLGFYDFALELAQETWLLDADAQEKSRINKLIAQLSVQPIEQTRKDFEQLASNIAQDPENINVTVGSFVDKRRYCCDYDDILHVSPLPDLSWMDHE